MRYVLLISTVIMVAVGQLFLKKGVDMTPVKADLTSIIHTLFTPHIILGFIFYGGASIISLFALQKFPLSIFLPSMSLAYVIILFTSNYFFGEPITGMKVFGVLLIMVGVVCLSRV